jgi:hypothetical protein
MNQIIIHGHTHVDPETFSPETKDAKKPIGQKLEVFTNDFNGLIGLGIQEGKSDGHCFYIGIDEALALSDALKNIATVQAKRKKSK